MQHYSFLRAFFTILLSGVICATLLVFFSPGERYIEQYTRQNNVIERNETRSESSDTKKIIGLVAGHYGFNNGNQCGSEYNFVKESDVNLRIAVMVRDYLMNRGYTVDLMHEFDPELSDYTALALVAIHANDCSPDKDNSGFNLSLAQKNTYPAESKRLRDCMNAYYEQYTGLPYLGDHPADGDEMLYTFNTVNDYTTISVIHTGSLSSDYRILSEKAEAVAKGIGDGIICYVENTPLNPKMLQGAAPADEEEEKSSVDTYLPLQSPLGMNY